MKQKQILENINKQKDNSSEINLNETVPKSSRTHTTHTSYTHRKFSIKNLRRLVITRKLTQSKHNTTQHNIIFVRTQCFREKIARKNMTKQSKHTY